MSEQIRELTRILDKINTDHGKLKAHVKMLEARVKGLEREVTQLKAGK